MKNEMLQYLESCQEELKQLIRDLCAIPAPSHHEEQRAAFCRRWLEESQSAVLAVNKRMFPSYSLPFSILNKFIMICIKHISSGILRN